MYIYIYIYCIHHIYSVHIGIALLIFALRWKMQVFHTGKEIINVRISCSCFSMSQNPSLESKRLCTACLQTLRSKKHFTETRQFSLSSDCWASKFVTPMDRIHPRRTDSSKARQLSSISHNVKKETKTSTNPNLRCGDWTIHTIFDGFIRILCHVPFSLSCHQEDDSILKLFLFNLNFAHAIPEKFHVLPSIYFLSFSNLIYPLSSKVPKGLKAPGHFGHTLVIHFVEMTVWACHLSSVPR